MKQKKLIRAFGMFFAVMLVFTVLSRAADSVNVIQVDTKSIQNQLVTHTVSGTGKVEGIQEQAVFTLENLKVEQTMAQVGQSVKKGDTLFSLSLDSIQEAIKDKEDEIETLNLQIKDLESQDAVSAQKKSSEQAWARQSYSIAAQSSSVTVDNARLELKVAQERLDAFYRQKEEAQRQAEENVADGFSDGVGGFVSGALPGQEEDSLIEEDGFGSGQAEEDGMDDASSAGTDTADTGMGTAETSVSTADADAATEQALADDVRAKQENLNQAIASQNQSMASAAQTVTDANIPDPSDSSLENAKRELANAQEDLEELNQLLEAGGNVVSPADGSIKSFAAETGSLTGQTAAAVLYLTSGGLRMTGSIHKDDLKYVEIGQTVKITNNNGKDIEGAIVESIREDDTDPDQRILTIQLPQDALSIGETASFTISREAGPYNACVPLSALYEENGSFYVYVIETSNTVLGEVMVARRTDVTVKDKNQAIAALEGGNLSSSQKIIVDSDRSIAEGSRVRPREP